MNNIVICPNCHEFVIIEQLNCKIFRHGVYKQTGVQIDPHLCEEICRELKNKNLIYGCGKPFQIIIDVNLDIQVVKCGYI